MKKKTTWFVCFFWLLLVINASAFYDPGLQRWINRDLIEEEGGINLYDLSFNDPTDYIDAEGLEGTNDTCFDENNDGARNSNRTGHKGNKNSDKHSNAEGYGGKRSKPNMAGPPPTAAQREAINAQKMREGKIPDPKASMRNKGPKKKPGGSVADAAIAAYFAWRDYEDAVERARELDKQLFPYMTQLPWPRPPVLLPDIEPTCPK